VAQRDQHSGFSLKPLMSLLHRAVEMRYPVDLPLKPTREDVDTFFRQAQTVLEFIERKLAALSSGAQAPD